jgi:Domain of unknown function (DUF4384)
MRSLWLVVIIGVGVLSCCAQQPGQDLQMQIVLEQQTGSAFRVVSPQHVFKTGDMIRFRVRSSSDGFLYVSNRAASGKYSDLFPAKGADNRLEHGKDYRIPAASRSWFRIEKPAGYETIFFTFTSSPLLRRNEAAPTTTYVKPPPQAPPAELIPRCDDALFRARGDCLDVNAGPSAVPAGTLAGSDALTPRDVSIVQGPDVSVVTPATPGDTPIIYEFRIAHR